MRASICADGITSHPRCTLVETNDPGGSVGFEADPYTVVSGLETTVEMATRFLNCQGCDSETTVSA